MTFDQWWDHYLAADGNEIFSDYEKEPARAAWNAAVCQASNVAVRHFINGHSVAGPEFANAGAREILKLVDGTEPQSSEGAK